jgi:hypothetical protein
MNELQKRHEIESGQPAKTEWPEYQAWLYGYHGWLETKAIKSHKLEEQLKEVQERLEYALEMTMSPACEDWVKSALELIEEILGEDED